MKKKSVSIIILAILIFSALSPVYAASAVMYSADGRTIEVLDADIEAYKAVGWYTEPPVLMYAGDGRTLYVIPSEVNAYKAVGWYTEPPVLMYAADGRTLYVIPSEVNVYKAVGWYTEPPVLMYAADGRTLYVIPSEVNVYKAVGWYTEPVTGNSKSNKNLLPNMTASEKRGLNVFLSNFSEAYLQSYSNDASNEAYELINFAFLHNLINSPNKIIYTDYCAGISASDIDYTLNRFLGRSVPHKSAYITIGGWEYEWEYTDGIFLTPAADGESYAVFSIANELYDNNDGTYTVSFEIFSDYDDYGAVSLPQWYSYTIDEARKLCEKSGSGTAVIKPKKFNGKDTYELVRYQTANR